MSVEAIQRASLQWFRVTIEFLFDFYVRWALPTLRMLRFFQKRFRIFVSKNVIERIIVAYLQLKKSTGSLHDRKTTTNRWLR